MAQFTTTFSPAASNTIDSGGSGVYATVRGGNALALEGVAGNVYNYFDNTNYAVHRSFLTFNTATLGTNATIVSAFLRLPGTGSVLNGNTDTIVIVSSTPASNTSIATSDWGNIGATSFGSLAFASWSTTLNNDITLNATGLAAIATTGYTKLGLRTLNEINNTTPTVDNHVSFTSSIILSVTYSVPDSGLLMGDI